MTRISPGTLFSLFPIHAAAHPNLKLCGGLFFHLARLLDHRMYVVYCFIPAENDVYTQNLLCDSET